MPIGRSTNKSDVYPINGNRLVSALSTEDRDYFLSKSTLIELTLGEVLSEPGDATEFCYFPLKGVISLVTLMTSGAGAEVGIVGTEGMVGFNVLLGTPNAPHQALVQGPGSALRIPSADLLKLSYQSKDAHELLLAYISSVVTLISQGAACNALHKAEVRLARWILLVQDRMNGDALPITHEFLANMLGIRRATVTVVANMLEQDGLISLGRRDIRVLDRDRLVKISCECYKTMSDATLRDLKLPL